MLLHFQKESDIMSRNFDVISLSLFEKDIILL